MAHCLRTQKQTYRCYAIKEIKKIDFKKVVIMDDSSNRDQCQQTRRYRNVNSVQQTPR